MKLEEAAELLRNNITPKASIQSWADLGCGSGVFTQALANLLAQGSTIYAVDRNKTSLDKIHTNNNIRLEKLCRDFIKDQLPGNLDGILMANSFHYVNNKNSFIKKLK